MKLSILNQFKWTETDNVLAFLSENLSAI